MDAKELRELIWKSEAMFERRKFRRMIFTVLLYAAACFGIIYLQGQLQVDNIWHILGEIGSCIFLGAIAYYFNLLLWSHIFKKSQDENATLEYLRKRLEEKEQDDNN